MNIEEIERLEDEQDEASARDYDAREAAGLLTPDEREVVPLEQAFAEIEAERNVKTLLAEVERCHTYLDNIRRQLRIECADLGDNDWDDNLHLSDVIEKHLARPAARRIAQLEQAALNKDA